jgi:predicted nucleic acid-binding protein
MLVIADASPLHYLILIAATDILPALFDRLVIPRAVVAELRHPRASAVKKPSQWHAVDGPPGIKAFFFLHLPAAPS